MVKKAVFVIAALCILLIISISKVMALQAKLEESQKEHITYNMALPAVMVNDKLYYCKYNKIVDAPDESEIAGRITNYIQPSRVPETNDTSNTICCVNQPYAFVDGDLIVYAVNVHLSGALPEHTVDAWFYCEPYN